MSIVSKEEMCSKLEEAIWLFNAEENVDCEPELQELVHSNGYENCAVSIDHMHEGSRSDTYSVVVAWEDENGIQLYVDSIITS